MHVRVLQFLETFGSKMPIFEMFALLLGTYIHHI